MAAEPLYRAADSAQDKCTETVLNINPEIIEWLSPFTARTYGLCVRLAMHIARDGKVPVSQVRNVLGLSRFERGLNLAKLGKLFVVADGRVDLNDYCWTAEQVEARS